MSRAIPTAKWISAEVALGPTRFFFRDARWYEVGPGYVNHLRRRVTQVLSQPVPVGLPAWRSGEEERAYNQRVGGKAGFVCLNRQLVRTEAHPRGIELCDLLGPDDELIHVKRARSSAPLSHLFAQGMVSAEQLLFDEVARARLRELVQDRKPKRLCRLGGCPSMWSSPWPWGESCRRILFSPSHKSYSFAALTGYGNDICGYRWSGFHSKRRLRTCLRS